MSHKILKPYKTYYRSSILCYLIFCAITLTHAQLHSIDSLEKLRSAVIDTNQVIVSNKLSFQYLRIASYDRAQASANHALSMSKQLGYRKGEAKGLINLGNVFLSKSEYPIAREYYSSALSIAEELNDNLIASHCTNNLGEVFRRWGNFEKALFYFLQSLKACEKISDKLEEAETWNNIGLLYNQMGNPQKAIECFEKALLISKEFNNSFDLSVNLANLAGVYCSIGEFDRSLSYYDQSLIIERRVNNRVGVGKDLLGIGIVCLKQNLYDEAMRYFMEALEIGYAIGDKSIVGSGLNSIGNIFMQRKNTTEALSYFEKFLAIAQETQSLEDIRDAYFNLGMVHSERNDYKSAFRYHVLYSNIKDSLFNSKNNQHISQMQARYESEKKEQEIENLKKEKEFQLEINVNQKIIFGAAVFVILLAGAALYFRWQVIRHKNILLKERVDAQNRELTTVALLVSKKNKAFAQLKNKLETPSVGVSDYGLTRELIKDIDHEIAFDEEWSTFKYHFEKVHPDFFAKLLQLAPSLSMTELRLCAYLRSNLTTKEISKLTNTTVRSVQQAKYRINAKFSHRERKLGDFLIKL